jgi:hypothetical protein
MWPYIIFPVLYNWKPYFFRIGRPDKFVFFRIVHYVREVTRWFLSFASKQNKPENEWSLYKWWNIQC